MDVDRQTATERSDLMQTESRVDSPQKPYVTASDLKSVYYLSPSWVERLGSADLYRPNPQWLGGAKMRLYDRGRVEQFIEANQVDYEQLKVQRERRSAAAKVANEIKASQLAEWAKTVEVEIEVDQLPKNLDKAATFYFQERRFQYGRMPSSNECGEQGERGIVAMLRHRYTNYHDLLDLLKGKVGRNAAYRILRRRVNQAACTAADIDYGDGSKWNDVEEAWIVEEMSEQ